MFELKKLEDEKRAVLDEIKVEAAQALLDILDAIDKGDKVLPIQLASTASDHPSLLQSAAVSMPQVRVVGQQTLLPNSGSFVNSRRSALGVSSDVGDYMWRGGEDSEGCCKI